MKNPLFSSFQIKTVTTTEFCQGHTMRWGVAWSFLPDVVVQVCLPTINFMFFETNVSISIQLCLRVTDLNTESAGQFAHNKLAHNNANSAPLENSP